MHTGQRAQKEGPHHRSTSTGGWSRTAVCPAALRTGPKRPTWACQAVCRTGVRDAMGGEVVSTRHAAQAVDSKCPTGARLGREGVCTRCAHGPVAWVCTVAGCRRAGANTSSCDALAGAGVTASSPVDGRLERALVTRQDLHVLQVESHNRKMVCLLCSDRVDKLRVLDL